MLIENQIGTEILNAAFEIHSAFGPGLLESTYEKCLVYELNERGLLVRRQVPMPIIYKGMEIDRGYRVDLLVEDKVIVELKTVDAFNVNHLAQLLTYMKLTECKLGYLLNFKTSSLKKGIRRVILDQQSGTRL
jgi:GxxExxY protein